MAPEIKIGSMAEQTTPLWPLEHPVESADSNAKATSRIGGPRFSARSLIRSHRVAMRSLTELAKLTLPIAGRLLDAPAVTW